MHASNTPIGKKKRKTTRTFLFNTQSRHPLRIRKLRQQADYAANLLAKHIPAELEEISVVFVSKGKIAKIHQDFMQDSSATDVITFEHGEIYICPAIAEIQRKPHKHSLHQEVLTYIIHGILHLCGWNDLTEKEFHCMAKKQSDILKKVLQTIP